MFANICALLCAICFTTTCVILIISAFMQRHKRKRAKIYYVSVVLASLSALFLFLPYYTSEVEANANAWPWFTPLLASLHHVIRLFVVDADFGEIFGKFAVAGLKPWLSSLLRGIASALFILCPALSAGGILSFFDEFTAHRRYLFHHWADTYIFSKLNDRSIELARSLKSNHPNCLIAFTDVFKTNEEASYELIEKAEELDAILFKKDITVINFRWHSKKSKLYFFIIGDKEAENINQTISLCLPPDTKNNKKQGKESLRMPSDGKPNRNSYKSSGYDYERIGETRVYFFSMHSTSEQQLSSVTPQHIKLCKINSVRSQIYRMINDAGYHIFHSAVPSGHTVINPSTGKADEEKLISAVIVGLGNHGTEMLKGLSWFCQMYPYRLEITAFEKDCQAESHFRSQCPELMDEKHNNNFATDGEAHYHIRINPRFSHPLLEDLKNKSEDRKESPQTAIGYDINSFEFDCAIESIGEVTYVLVALGDDDLNIQTATKIRALLRRKGMSPFIHTIVYNPYKQELLENGIGDSNEKNNIVPTGNITSNYSEECILNSDIESTALQSHLEWTRRKAEEEHLPEEACQQRLKDAEKEFWRYGYHYHSSIALALHSKFKKGFQFGAYTQEAVPGATKPIEKRNEAEKLFLRKLEHQRWNAYLRSEGYVLGGSRDNLAKTHPNLVPFGDLHPDQHPKDDD